MDEAFRVWLLKERDGGQARPASLGGTARVARERDRRISSGRRRGRGRRPEGRGRIRTKPAGPGAPLPPAAPRAASPGAATSRGAGPEGTAVPGTAAPACIWPGRGRGTRGPQGWGRRRPDPGRAGAGGRGRG